MATTTRSSCPAEVFNAQGGPWVITLSNHNQFARFCSDIIDRSNLAADTRFTTNLLRAANREALIPEINQALACRPRQELLERLACAGVFCGEALGLQQAMTSQRASLGCACHKNS